MISLPKQPESAFVIVDVQEKLCRVMPDIDQRLAKMAKATAIMGVFEIPTIVTEQYPKGLGVTMPALSDQLLQNVEKIEKTSFSCWGEPVFVDAVKSLRKQSLIVIGMETHVCVQQTVLDALSNGHAVTLLSDCVCSRNAHDERTALSLMERAGAVVTTLEAVAFNFMRDSKHDKFKAISKIVVS